MNPKASEESKTVESLDGFLTLVYEGRSQEVAAALKACPRLATEVDVYGNTPLLCLAGFDPLRIGKDHVQCLRVLLSRSDTAACTAQKENVLHLAARQGNVRFVSILLDHCDARALDKNKESALMNAAMCGSIDCVRVLLPHSDPLGVDSSGFNAFLWAAWGVSPQNEGAQCLRTLAAYGDTHRIDHEGFNALTWVARGGSHEAVEFLMEQLDPNGMDKKGMTALMHAVGKEDVERVKLLMTRTDTSLTDQRGRTALMHAVIMEDLESVQALAYCSPEKRDRGGLSAFDMALHKQYWACADVLVMNHPRPAEQAKRALKIVPDAQWMPQALACLERETLAQALESSIESQVEEAAGVRRARSTRAIGTFPKPVRL